MTLTSSWRAIEELLEDSTATIDTAPLITRHAWQTDSTLLDQHSAWNVDYSGANGDVFLETQIEYEQEEMPAGIEDMMSQALKSQAGGSLHDLLYPEDEVINDMMELETKMGPVISEEFRHLPNYNPEGPLSKKAKRSRKKGMKTAYPALPFHLREMMQMANMKYIESSNSEAMQIIREVMKERPDAHEAWLTLSMIYNSSGDIHKMVQCKMMAAHLSSTNSDLWKSLADTSMTLGHIDQAIYCYKKARKADPTDLDCIFQTSKLLIDRGMLEEAKTGLESIIAGKYRLPLMIVAPLDGDTIKALAKIYLKQNRADLAVELFERLLQADRDDPLPEMAHFHNEDQDDDEFEESENILNEASMGTQVFKRQRMGFEELHNLSELYLELDQPQKALDLVHEGVCKLSGIDPDSVSYFNGDYNVVLSHIPIELRVKVGLCLLDLGSGVAAEGHLWTIYETPRALETYPEVFFDIGEMYLKKNEFSLALKMFSSILECNYESLEVTRKIADCYTRLGDNQNALKSFESSMRRFVNILVLKMTPNDVTVQNHIIMLLESMGNDKMAAQMQSKFLRLREKEALMNSKHKNIESTPNPNPFQKPLFSVRTEIRKLKKGENEKAKRNAETTKLTEENLINYQRLSVLSKQLNRKSSITEYFFLGKKLVDSFRKIDRIKSKSKECDAEAVLIYKRVFSLEMGSGFENIERRDDTSDQETVLGISFSDWYCFLIDFAFHAVREGKFEDSIHALIGGLECASFNSNSRKRVELQLCLLGVSFYQGNYEQMAAIVRSYCFIGPFVATGLRLYSAVFSKGGPGAINAFSASWNLKFLFRQVQKLRGQSLVYPPVALVHLYSTYAHMLFCSKSYGTAIQFYLRAWNISPGDPIINFSLGIAYLHWSTQKAETKHGHIVTGFSFLKRYIEICSFNAESSYNVGRAVHQVGLLHLAVNFYKQALRSQVFRRSAAYNLALVYFSVGCSHLASNVLRNYWTF